MTVKKLLLLALTLALVGCALAAGVTRDVLRFREEHEEEVPPHFAMIEELNPEEANISVSL